MSKRKAPRELVSEASTPLQRLLAAAARDPRVEPLLLDLARAARFIQESVSRDTIVSVRMPLGPSRLILEALTPTTDDAAEYVDDDGRTRRELWGLDDDGDVWRIHIMVES